MCSTNIDADVPQLVAVLERIVTWPPALLVPGSSMSHLQSVLECSCSGLDLLRTAVLWPAVRAQMHRSPVLAPEPIAPLFASLAGSDHKCLIADVSSRRNRADSGECNRGAREQPDACAASHCKPALHTQPILRPTRHPRGLAHIHAMPCHHADDWCSSCRAWLSISIRASSRSRHSWHLRQCCSSMHVQFAHHL